MDWLGTGLSIIIAVAGVAVSYGLLSGQVASLKEHVTRLEADKASREAHDTLVARLAVIEAQLVAALAMLHEIAGRLAVGKDRD